jgi:hypothetical protein
MGFFKMWWLGEVSNFPQEPREAPPTPLMIYFCLKYRRSGSILVCRCDCLLEECPEASSVGGTALERGQP